jgi:hypothetical protein
MEPDWERKLLEASTRETRAHEERFLSLVEQAEGKIDLATAKSLMKTYSDKPDYGTQERVESVLATADPVIIVEALLEEMPRLVEEAPEWAETLLGQELEHRSSIVISAMNKMPQRVIEAVKTVAARPEFTSFYQNAKLLNPKNA